MMGLGLSLSSPSSILEPKPVALDLAEGPLEADMMKRHYASRGGVVSRLRAGGLSSPFLLSS